MQNLQHYKKTGISLIQIIITFQLRFVRLEPFIMYFL